MTMFVTLVVFGFVISILQRRPAVQRHTQPWCAHVIWVPPARTGDAIVDQRNLRDRSRWRCMHVNRV